MEQFININLSQRESEIAEKLLQGKLNKEIAHELQISIHTVKKHVKNIYKKAGIRNRINFIQYIYKQIA